MNFKEYAVGLCLAFALWYGMQYVFFGTTRTDQTETTFIAPQEKREYKPLNVEIDFWDTKRPVAARLTDIETEWAVLQFSTDGASLQSADFKRELGGVAKTIRALFPVTDTEREERCFLVGLNEKTPFYYNLVSQSETDIDSYIVYQVDTNECTIRKKFIIDKHRPCIEMVLDIIPHAGYTGTIEPRIFFPAPLMPDIKESDVISSVVVDQSGIFDKKPVNHLDVQRGWFKPQIFGSDSRYFVYSMIRDEHHFAQRAYYRLENKDRLFSVLEGPVVTTPSSWHLSFYFGPKDVALLNSADDRLEKTLDFSGIFSLVAKFLLMLITWFYKYLHNYGLAIIALTLLIQVALLPLSLRNGEEKFKKQQAEYQRRLAIIKHRFKDDPEKLAVEQAELLRTHGMPSLGCIIPLLIQIPIFFALNRVLSSSFELYQAPMLWIKDLSAKDPYYILPLIVMLATLVQDGKGADSQQRLNKIVMAVVLGALMTTFSAGLTLYFAAGRVFGLIQSRIVKYFNLV